MLLTPHGKTYMMISNDLIKVNIAGTNVSFQEACDTASRRGLAR